MNLLVTASLSSVCTPFSSTYSFTNLSDWSQAEKHRSPCKITPTFSKTQTCTNLPDWYDPRLKNTDRHVKFHGLQPDTDLHKRVWLIPGWKTQIAMWNYTDSNQTQTCTNLPDWYHPRLKNTDRHVKLHGLQYRHRPAQTCLTDPRLRSAVRHVTLHGLQYRQSLETRREGEGGECGQKASDGGNGERVQRSVCVCVWVCVCVCYWLCAIGCVRHAVCSFSWPLP